jgi:hypothetical protein
MPSRRFVLQAMGVTAAAATAFGHASMAEGSDAPQGDVTAPPWWLVAPLSVGTRIGREWRIADLAPIAQGATILSLVHRDQRTARVHICARSGQPRGLAHTGLFDLVLMDGGQGDHPTDESLGRVLKQVARHIGRNELMVDDEGLRAVVRLQSHPDREARYGPQALV